ncbi:hypothetical protein CY34DRAFT_799965 [Suillus luteus UH-Slu-Lm8-n1]|uniref:Uncharacterized protein n=1 Tax=Suillus luteus UH-Slu-Lm8-n1 TaxID=930992 RepID=A0A0D0BAP9_9AGAM|nr:hypothetical protein CY34DRAFT_799965 [Suillus luteus UH-Slu-Lm8-n1]
MLMKKGRSASSRSKQKSKDWYSIMPVTRKLKSVAVITKFFQKPDWVMVLIDPKLKCKLLVTPIRGSI